MQPLVPAISPDRAGNLFPARLQSLRYLLHVSVLPGVDRAELASVIETEPGFLLTFLALGKQASSAPDIWYEQIPLPLMRAVVLDICQTMKPVSEPEDGTSPATTTALIRSLIAAELARSSAVTDPDVARLAGLLATEDREVVNMLLSVGWSPGMTDAISFYRAEPEELQGASGLIRCVAIAEKLVSAVNDPDRLDPFLRLCCAEILQLDEETVYELLGRVTEQLRNISAQVTEASYSLADTLGKLARMHAYHKALLQMSGDIPIDECLRQFGQVALGYSQSLCFLRENNQLQCGAGDAGIAVAVNSEQSQLARALRFQRADIIQPDQCRSLADRQTNDRLGGGGMLLVPFGQQGVLAFGVAAATGGHQTDPVLLNSFSEAAADFLAYRTADEQEPAIPVSLFRQRVSEVTHEVNNPLAIVQNYLKTLSMKLDEDAPVQSDIQTIGQEIMRVSTIVRKYGQIGATEDMLVATINVNDIIRQLTSVMQGSREDISFTLDLDETMPGVTLAPDSLKQILVNLMKNSAEALSQTERATPQIRVSTCGAVNLGGTRYVEVTIADNGPGIPPEVESRLFEANNSSKSGQHAGLGLNIVKQLTDDMGGLISCRTVRSPDDRSGTSFQLLVPLAGKDAANQ
ncbi:MAG: HAMP domain-containing histidine kinase [Pseudomonadales bacterium]|nr:HAMP domain-containing histidine kinase [Pseudomonadales bacterium]